LNKKLRNKLTIITSNEKTKKLTNITITNTLIDRRIATYFLGQTILSTSLYTLPKKYLNSNNCIKYFSYLFFLLRKTYKTKITNKKATKNIIKLDQSIIKNLLARNTKKNEINTNKIKTKLKYDILLF
jgi:hypothetical protein